MYFAPKDHEAASVVGDGKTDVDDENEKLSDKACCVTKDYDRITISLAG